MMNCLNCGKSQEVLSRVLLVCPECLRDDFDQVAAWVGLVHNRARGAFGLPPVPPQAEAEPVCHRCANACRPALGQPGYCGVRFNLDGKMSGPEPDVELAWYYDPLPTNCVAATMCACSRDPERPSSMPARKAAGNGHNLAVFYHSCTFDCLFCQNWAFRLHRQPGNRMTALELAGKADKQTACICFFGGDPTPQLEHALETSLRAIENRKDRPPHICWETNGNMDASLLRRMVEVSLRSGGCIKVDVKAWSDGVHRALCGTGNRRTLENFSWLAGKARLRPDPPLVVASTLLVPGYVDVWEVRRIAEFIAGLDAAIPYTLLAFHPAFYMGDLPVTPRSQAEHCLAEARRAGLQRVHLGNQHLLSDPE